MSHGLKLEKEFSKVLRGGKLLKVEYIGNKFIPFLPAKDGL